MKNYNSPKPVSEEKTAAASYILNFYQEVSALTDNLAQYINYMTEIAQTYGGEAAGRNMPENEKKVLKEVVQTLRYYVIKTNVQYECIREHIKEKRDKTEERKINVLYNEIKTKFMISQKTIEEYTKFMNLFLIRNVMKQLLESSQDIIDSLNSEKSNEVNYYE